MNNLKDLKEKIEEIVNRFYIASGGSDSSIDEVEIKVMDIHTPAQKLTKLMEILFLSYSKALYREVEERVIEKMIIEIAKISGQWEAKTIEYIEGNKKAFSDILERLKHISTN